MDIEDIKKAGVDDSDRISKKEVSVKDKDKKIKIEEIKTKRDASRFKLKKFLKKIKKFFKKFWFVVWKDDSLKGWFFTIIFLLIFIKLIFFPALNFVTGTALPLAIVESCSMYHDGNLLSNYDTWWLNHKINYAQYGINKTEFEDFKFKRGFNKGDILFIVRASPEKLKIGDVIIFNWKIKYPIIHRIVNIKYKEGKYVFSTMGDNVGHTQEFEVEINEEQLVGKAIFKIVPSLGWVKLIGTDIWNKIVRNQSFHYISEGFCEEN